MVAPGVRCFGGDVNPLHIEILGPPVPKQRPRAARSRDGSGKLYVFTPKKTVDYEKIVQAATIAAMQKWRVENERHWNAQKRYAVSMWFFVPDRRVRDLDNLQKSILDALNKLVYDDDRQVDEIYAVRDYSPKNPRAVVVVRTL